MLSFVLFACLRKCRKPGGIRLRGCPTRQGLIVVVPAMLMLMPPAAAYPFAFPAPRTGFLTRALRPAVMAPFAAHGVPSAIVATAPIIGNRRRQVFNCRLV